MYDAESMPYIMFPYLPYGDGCRGVVINDLFNVVCILVSMLGCNYGQFFSKKLKYLRLYHYAYIV